MYMLLLNLFTFFMFQLLLIYLLRMYLFSLRATTFNKIIVIVNLLVVRR